jgi:large subunit ribosomal protein L4e
MAARPAISIQSFAADAASATLVLPAVFTAPIRPDIVKIVHTNMAKNRRQPYAVFWKAGHQHSAESWGTGRAVARIPRVSGGGTNRSGQAAFGNMVRKGRMFNPTKIWRRWHRHVNVNQKRYAVVSALAASAQAPLVEARGHKIEHVPEVPLVVPATVEALKKTREVLSMCEKIGAMDDVVRARESRHVRPGVGKARNRRYLVRRGPLIVYKEDNGLAKACRNLPGVEVAQVSRLNLLQLAPGGHLGRFIIWTESAFASLDEVFSKFTLPRAHMTNADVARIINSDEIQSHVRPALRPSPRASVKLNPLTNMAAMKKLNPYAPRFKELEKVKASTKKERETKRAKFTKKRKATAEAAKKAAKKPKKAEKAKKSASKKSDE